MTELRLSSKKRDSNLELFRILTMLLIIAHHYVVNSGLREDAIYGNPLLLKSQFLLLFGAWGKIGINCFVFITGYFMCKSEITLRKFLKLLFEVEFYKIVVTLIFILSGYEALSLRSIAPMVLFRNIDKGFTTCFLLFFLFIPFLNILVRNLTKKQHQLLLLLCFFIFTVIGSIPKFYVNFNYVTWFCVLYVFSSYVRLYPVSTLEKHRLWVFVFPLTLLFSSVAVLICNYMSVKFNLNDNCAYFFVSDSNKILAVVTGFSAFMFFKTLSVPYSKIINTVASTTFGVLLIHANSDIMRQWLWRDTLHNVDMYSSDWIYLHAVLSVLGVFVICSLIDYIRIKFVEIPFFKYFDYLCAQRKKCD